MKEASKEKRINFKIPLEMHTDLKVMAAERNITMKLLIMRIFDKEIRKYYEKR